MKQLTRAERYVPFVNTRRRMASSRWRRRRGAAGRVFDRGQHLRCNPAEIPRLVGGRFKFVSANPGVFIEPDALRRVRVVGRYAAMHLMENALAEQNDDLAVRKTTGAAEEICIDKTTAGAREGFIEPANLLPQIAGQKKRIALQHGTEPAALRRSGRRGDAEQAIPVISPL